MRRRRDLGLLVVAALLLLAAVAYFAWSQRSLDRRREATLARVPDFPAPNQTQVRARAAREPERPIAQAAVARAPASATAHDALSSFALAGAPANVAVVHVNALLNTPLFERLRECMPNEFAEMEKGGARMGLDLTRDLDRVAFTSAGMAISGFFEGKPIAQSIAGADARREDYRGAALYAGATGCVAQTGNLILIGHTADCRPLVDLALAPTPADAQGEIYGDLFVRSDVSTLRDDAAPGRLRTVLDGLSGLTLRANVWDSVALTLEGSPAPGRSVRDLQEMARGAISFAKAQLDEDDVEYRALADLAKVAQDADRLQIDLAIPAQELFERLHFPCPGREAVRNQNSSP